MNNYLGLYLLTRLDGLYAAFKFLTILSSIVTVAAFITWLVSAIDYGNKLDQHIKKTLKISIPILIVSSLLLVSTPTKNEAIFIIAGGKTIDFIQNDTSICKLPAQTTAIISNYLDKQIKEIQTTKQK